MDIFVSYSRKDRERAYRIVDDLAAAGFEVWIDRSLEVGDDWEKTIERELREARDVILLLSENALKSKWVMHEGSMAYALQKNLFPVLLSDISPRELPIWASRIQYQQFHGTDYTIAIQELIRRLTPVDQLKKLLAKQHDIFVRTQALPGADFLRNIKGSLQETSPLDPEMAGVLLLAALQYDMDADFWIELARRNNVNIFAVLLGQLENAGFRFRRAIIRALRSIATLEESEIFFKFLADPYPQVRKAAIQALWRQTTLRSRLLDALVFERFIPSGAFKMGIDELPPLDGNDRPLTDFDKLGFAEFPAHDVHTDSYFIDTFPVTCSDYLLFLQDTKPDAIRTRKLSSEISGNEQVAITNLNWEDACEYARWAEKQLPTEAEWEKAARGPRSFLFPWGNRFEAGRAHTVESGIKHLQPVTAYSPQGDSPYNVACMCGNVWEWVSDWYQDDYYRAETCMENPSGPSQGNGKVLRGGSYKENAQNANGYRRMGFSPLRARTDIGFRCAFSERELEGKA